LGNLNQDLKGATKLANENDTATTVNVKINGELKDSAARVLALYGMTTADAVHAFLTSVVKKQGLPAGMEQTKADHDDWFKASVREAMEDDRPGIPHEEVIAGIKARIDAKANSVGFDVV
jgi:DNA-damage-inducible protein J